MSRPWCFATSLEGAREVHGLAGVWERILLEKARVLSLFLSRVSGFNFDSSATEEPLVVFFFFVAGPPTIVADLSLSRLGGNESTTFYRHIEVSELSLIRFLSKQV